MDDCLPIFDKVVRYMKQRVFSRSGVRPVATERRPPVNPVPVQNVPVEPLPEPTPTKAKRSAPKITVRKLKSMEPDQYVGDIDKVLKKRFFKGVCHPMLLHVDFLRKCTTLSDGRQIQK